jgi:pyridoxal phosphate enzyme (YggS family)
MSLISENLLRVNERIKDVCTRVSRKPEGISVVAVTKTVPSETIQEAVDAGVRILGENRVQEAASKMDGVSGDIAWHMVGHLQSNKVRKAVTMFDMIQSVDSVDLAAEIDKRCGQTGRMMDVLIEVNTSAEGTKYGITPEEAPELVERVSKLDNLVVKGLMTIGAFTDDERLVRDCFRTLRELAERIKRSGIDNVEMQFLSMGMTSDYELAIEEGSNMVRIGTAIFGARQT